MHDHYGHIAAVEGPVLNVNRRQRQDAAIVSSCGELLQEPVVDAERGTAAVVLRSDEITPG